VIDVSENPASLTNLNDSGRLSFRHVDIEIKNIHSTLLTAAYVLVQYVALALS
jgi:hypothetical protein